MVPGSEEKSYQVMSLDGYFVLKFNGALEAEEADGFEQEIPKLVEAPLRHVIVNCENLSMIAKPWLRPLLRLVNTVRSVNKEVRFILVSQEILKFFSSQGMDGAFKISPSLREAQVELGLVTKKALDVAFINPFIDGTLHVLKVQAQTEATAGKIYVKKEGDRFLGDVSGVIGIVSDAFNGAVVISFPEATFLKIMSRMMGENYTAMCKEIEDGAGELTNIIFGCTKTKLNELGYGVKTALPSVVTGKDHSVYSMTKGPTVVVPFQTDVGGFFIEICLSG